MPKHSITFTAKQWINDNEFSDLDSAIECIMEYASDFQFPDETDPDTINFDTIEYTGEGHAVLTFSFDLEQEEEEEKDDSQDPDGSEGEDL